MRMTFLDHVAAGLYTTALFSLLSGATALSFEPNRMSASVFGYVWDARGEPIPTAAVRLRNVVSGAVEATAVTTANGAFRFEDLDGGTYVVEYVNDSERVLAVGHVFSAAPGDTVATFIRLTSRPRGLAALFGNTTSIAAIAVSSAASIGLTAIAPPARDVTPER